MKISNAATSLVYEPSSSNYMRSRSRERHTGQSGLSERSPTRSSLNGTSIQLAGNGFLMEIATRAEGLSELQLAPIGIFLGYAALLATLISLML
jgi:hypothetical protein